jgi:hypothetical protein
MERECAFCAQTFRLAHYYAKTQLCGEACRAAARQRGELKSVDEVVRRQMLHNGRPGGDDPRRLLKRLPRWMTRITSVDALLPLPYEYTRGNRAYAAFGARLAHDRECLFQELQRWCPLAQQQADVVKYVLLEFLIPTDTIAQLCAIE